MIKKKNMPKDNNYDNENFISNKLTKNETRELLKLQKLISVNKNLNFDQTKHLLISNEYLIPKRMSSDYLSKQIAEKNTNC